ncbi:hypothetical protein AQ490_09190 [Wenjunlia vitaminophila]|uniref:Tetratricopeptide repeat protein n=1 Tax=Wenjunlia vitaminophila TaxID=76728 RepID=A0A0T6LLQ4_WENVI|nr:hypothetical protein [Wenjunlia vitaminophila]KRV46936.1 hypothetical protein AQ490_09190 [Wenjunlia vitaminophila]
MARANLRAAFMSGVTSTITAQQVFTDRTDETAAFNRSLVALHQTLDTAEVSPVVDRVQGRRNVLTFYGVGGIGKTTLSHELERRLLAGEGLDDVANEEQSEAVSVRIDVSEEGASDLENLLLRLRAGLGQLDNEWPAFDLALASYWVRAHPGEALQEFLDASPATRRASRGVRLGEQIAGNVAQALSSDFGGLAGMAQRAALGTYRAIRDRVREGRLLSECELFAELIEAEADYETLSFFPYLLAWDLERKVRRRNKRPRMCVFLDTFEVLGGQGDRTAERYVQRCVYLMPNVLFVITGRNRVDWADGGTSGELDFTGPERWPNLHFSNQTAEPRQHLVGYLSDSDADSYLQEALTQDGTSAIPPEVRSRIISGGQGLPLYLDLSVSHFVELLARGSQPAVEHFGGTFTAVAKRSIRDLPREERDLVRTAALVDRVDAALLRAGQPTLSDGSVARFLRRPFLTHDDAYELPYALHGALRAAISEADRGLPDGWSDRDRAEVAARLLRRLGERSQTATGRAAVAQALESGLKLSRDHGVFDDWMARATQHLVEAGQWTAIGTNLDGGPAELPEFRAMRAAIEGVWLRRTGRAVEAVEALDGADADLAPESLPGQLVRLHLAHALRNQGDYTRAAGIYRQLLGGEFATDADYWLSDYDYLNGRFTTALSTLRNQRAGDVAHEGERLRLIGHILRVNARFDDAAASYNEAITLARNADLAAAEAKALANLAQTACWSGDTATVSNAAARGRELLDLVPNPVELVKIRSAEAVCWAMADELAKAREAVADTRRLADAISYRGGHNLADVAQVLIGVSTGDHDGARRTRDALDERTRASGGNIYWVSVVTSWLDGLASAAAWHPTIDWVDGADAALGRWVAVVAA